MSEIIRCKDCRYWGVGVPKSAIIEPRELALWCGMQRRNHVADDFCSEARRRDKVELANDSIYFILKPGAFGWKFESLDDGKMYGASVLLNVEDKPEDAFPLLLQQVRQTLQELEEADGDEEKTHPKD